MGRCRNALPSVAPVPPILQQHSDDQDQDDDQIGEQILEDDQLCDMSAMLFLRSRMSSRYSSRKSLKSSLATKRRSVSSSTSLIFWRRPFRVSPKSPVACPIFSSYRFSDAEMLS